MTVQQQSLFSQPLPHGDANQVKRKGLTEGGELLMGAARSRRIRSRMSKSKRGPQRSSKRDKALRSAIKDDDETPQFEPARSLLLSSLRYWEVERDLIEERVASISR